jgi:hypothetical protein
MAVLQHTFVSLCGRHIDIVEDRIAPWRTKIQNMKGRELEYKKHGFMVTNND